jgi:hypothetical protein
MAIIKNQKQFYAGLTFAIFSVGLAWLSWRYPIGTAAQMGPGYWPRIIAIFVAVIGLLLIGKSCTGATETVSLPKFSILGWIYAAIITFPFVLEFAGLPIAVAVAVLLSSQASSESDWRSTLILMFGLAVFASLLFVYLLGLNIQLLPDWWQR